MRRIIRRRIGRNEGVVSFLRGFLLLLFFPFFFVSFFGVLQAGSIWKVRFTYTGWTFV